MTGKEQACMDNCARRFLESTQFVVRAAFLLPVVCLVWQPCVHGAVQCVCSNCGTVATTAIP